MTERIVVHLSDLHFGRTDPARVAAVRAYVTRLRPDVVAVSGDLTQRARPREFAEARAFLDTLPGLHVVVPGNHDIPLYDLLSRLTRPLARYRRYLDANEEPVVADDAVMVCGLNSARGLTLKSGRLGAAQVRRAAARLAGAAPGALKIVVTHHPFNLPAGHDEDDLIGSARSAMGALAAAGVDVFLAGHLHVSHAASSWERYRIAGHSALVVHAGTATSTRTRKETNAFNVLRIAPHAVTVEHVVWGNEAGAFAVARTGRFRRAAGGWADA